MHLSAERFVDVLEGRRALSSEPHLRHCERCQRQLEDLRSVMTAAASFEVPEPSPLFWDHLSNRVRNAVAQEAAPRRSLLWGFGRWQVLASAAVAAAVVVAVFVPRPPSSHQSPAAAVAASAAAADLATLPAFGSADDTSLALVGDLASQMDPESAVDTGLANHPGGIDEVVTTLTAGERVELQQILKAELAKS